MARSYQVSSRRKEGQKSTEGHNASEDRTGAEFSIPDAVNGVKEPAGSYFNPAKHYLELARQIAEDKQSTMSYQITR